MLASCEKLTTSVLNAAILWPSLSLSPIQYSHVYFFLVCWPIILLLLQMAWNFLARAQLYGLGLISIVFPMGSYS